MPVDSGVSGGDALLGELSLLALPQRPSRSVRRFLSLDWPLSHAAVGDDDDDGKTGSWPSATWRRSVEFQWFLMAAECKACQRNFALAQMETLYINTTVRFQRNMTASSARKILTTKKIETNMKKRIT